MPDVIASVYSFSGGSLEATVAGISFERLNSK
jgi:hypothetical protein